MSAAYSYNTRGNYDNYKDDLNFRTNERKPAYVFDTDRGAHATRENTVTTLAATKTNESVISDSLEPNRTPTSSFRAVRSSARLKHQQHLHTQSEGNTSPQNKPLNSDDDNTGDNSDEAIKTPGKPQLKELNTISALGEANVGHLRNDGNLRITDEAIQTLVETARNNPEEMKLHGDKLEIGRIMITETKPKEKTNIGNDGITEITGSDSTTSREIFKSSEKCESDDALIEHWYTKPEDTHEIENHLETSDDVQAPPGESELSFNQSQKKDTIDDKDETIRKKYEVPNSQFDLMQVTSKIAVSADEIRVQNAQHLRELPTTTKCNDTTKDPLLRQVHPEHANINEQEYYSDVTRHPTSNIDASHSDARFHFMSFLNHDWAPLTYPSHHISLEGHIDGRLVTYLVDTGANVSAIRAEIWRQLPPKTKHPPTPTHVATISTVNGQSIPVLGEVKLPFSINGKVYPFKALVIEAIAYDVILGRDFLEHYKAKIDLKNHVLELLSDITTPESLPFVELYAAREPNICFVCARTSFIIPPNSEVLVPGELESQRPIGETGLVHSRDDLPTRYNILGAAQIVNTWEGNSVPIRLLNPTEKPIRIFRRTRLGTYTAEDPAININELRQSDLEAEATRDLPTALDKEPRIPLNIDSSRLDTDQTQRLDKLLKDYDDVFAYTPDQLGRCSLVKHKIDTGNHPPIRLRSYRTSPANREEIDKQINDMLDNGVISPSVSPWAAPVVLVKKSDGTMRFCVDYRNNNMITRKDSHPLPRISEALDALGGAQWFSTLDLRSGYWQIEMDDESKEKTAFITYNGLFEFNALPFGLCNSPATFQRLMTYALRGLEWDICLVYIDDLIIFCRTFDAHLLHLERVFRRIREAGVRLKSVNVISSSQKSST